MTRLRLLPLSSALLLAVSLGSNDASAQVARRKCMLEGRDSAPAIQCDAEADACRTWLRFRHNHPFPYQTIAVTLYGPGDGVAILSEPPPVAAPREIVSLVGAAFDGHGSVHTLHFPVGQDGWLEDIVVRFSAVDGPPEQIAAADGSAMELPSGLVNRLEYLAEVLFSAPDIFYVDRADAEKDVTQKKLTNLAISQGDLQCLAGETTRKWTSLTASTEATAARKAARSWREMTALDRPAVLADDSAETIALHIPPRTDVASVRADFRRFAVASDYLIGAFNPKRGGLVLLGRNRQVGLDVLPPMRFETVATLATALGQPLGQSYERQRVLAGKIASGMYAGWDWAPIYLSPQLQDTEFGALLNLADQELKSYSEHANVRYAGFLYPDPPTFPFKTEPASHWLGDKTLTSTLIFNWNTTGFSSAGDDEQGKYITASSTTALPVAYILPLKNEPELLTKLRADLKIEVESVAGDASKIGSQYFAGLGDPILARVVQNVLLYQAMSASMPFSKSRLKESPTNAGTETKRSAAVSNILVSEVTRWLKDAASNGENRIPEVANLLQKSGRSVPQMAKLMATPDTNTRSFVQASRMLEAQTDRIGQLSADVFAKLLDVMAKGELADQEFVRRCASLGGTLTRDSKTMRCNYTRYSYGSFGYSYGTDRSYDSPAESSYKVAKSELTRLEERLKSERSSAEATVRSLLQMASERKTADDVAKQLAARPSATGDLAGVLDRVLKATSATASTSSIQTPSVVLSCNSSDNGGRRAQHRRAAVGPQILRCRRREGQQER